MCIRDSPSTGKLNIALNSTKIKAIKISLFTIEGKLVYKTEIMNTEQQSLDLSGLSSGTYLLNAEQDGQVIHSEKIILNK